MLFLEIRNSIAHLQYSNDQLRPFAADDNDGGADAVCVDAIRENEAVIERMAERIALIRIEVEDVRGTGTIRNGEVHMDPVPGTRGANGGGAGGSLSDEQLRAAMEERMRQMTTDEDDDGGLHL
ncbi:hypothetical protein BM221_007996 [Beauveria bassiana]|uniref:Uncharacterized protein n=1 Tax=Beauveria bassiana TaxID=176275 RepID=A0A2N6NEV2_BEABA|nr:hypothetical protein BM221_007996 [Beauveria bassiana]